MRDSDNVERFEAACNRHKSGIYNFCLRMLNEAQIEPGMIKMIPRKESSNKIPVTPLIQR